MLSSSNTYCIRTEIDPRDAAAAHFLPCDQQVLVHVGAQEACIAVTFHQLVDVVLNGGSAGKRQRKKGGHVGLNVLPEHVFISVYTYLSTK